MTSCLSQAITVPAASFVGAAQRINTTGVEQVYLRMQRACAAGEAGVGPDEPPFVLLAAETAPAANWGSTFLRALLDSLPCGKQVLLPELRGQGLSVDSDPAPLTIDSVTGEATAACWCVHVCAEPQGAAAAAAAPRPQNTRSAALRTPSHLEQRA